MLATQLLRWLGLELLLLSAPMAVLKPKPNSIAVTRNLRLADALGVPLGRTHLSTSVTSGVLRTFSSKASPCHLSAE